MYDLIFEYSLLFYNFMKNLILSEYFPIFKMD